MAGVNKNFIVKNGLEVNNGLIFTDVAKANVGIGSTNLSSLYKFQVNGGIGATSLTVTGVTTTTTAVITSSAVVGSAVTLNSSGINLTGGLVISGVSTANSYQIGINTVLHTNDGQITLAGIQTVDSITKASLERELQFSPNDFDDLNVLGISTLGSVTITSGIITAVSGVVTYFGDGSGLTGVPPIPAGSTNNVQYNNGSVTAGSNNFVFTGTHVGIGTSVPTDVANQSNTSILSVGIVTANSFYGSLIGNVNGNVTGNINATTGISTFTILKVGTGVTISGGIVTATSFYGDGSNLANTGSLIVANSGTQNILLTNITTGIVTAVSIDQTTLQWNSNTNTLNTTNIDLTDNLYVTGISSLGIATISQLSVSGVSTFAGIATVTGSTLFTKQLNVSGVSTFAGIATVTGSTLFTKQLNVSGVSTFTGIGTFNSTLFANQLSVVGVATATDFNSTSDANLKENIQTFENGLEVVSELRGVRFDWKKDHKPSIGVIAQELEEVLPELVSDTNPKTVNYNGLIGVLIEAVKELSQEVENLKNEINNQ